MACGGGTLIAFGLIVAGGIPLGVLLWAVFWPANTYAARPADAGETISGFDSPDDGSGGRGTVAPAPGGSSFAADGFHQRVQGGGGGEFEGPGGDDAGGLG